MIELKAAPSYLEYTQLPVCSRYIVWEVCNIAKFLSKAIQSSIVHPLQGGRAVATAILGIDIFSLGHLIEHVSISERK